MHNFFRFLIGIGIFFLIVIVGGILLALFSPLLIGGAYLFVIIAGIVGLILAIICFFTFIWYMSRKQPEAEKEAGNVNYSISQGKEVK